MRPRAELEVVEEEVEEEEEEEEEGREGGRVEKGPPSHGKGCGYLVMLQKLRAE
jgi:hypothetical protein